MWPRRSEDLARTTYYILVFNKATTINVTPDINTIKNNILPLIIK